MQFSRGSTFCIVVVVVAPAGDALLNYCEFRHGCNLHVKSFIANFVMVASRVVVCHVKLSRVNSRSIKIRVDLRRVTLIRYAAV
jgi:hypothetical protein